MKDVLVDTDILINFLRGKETAGYYLNSLLEDSTVYCSAITIAEIQAGMKDHEKDKTNALIDGLNIVEVNKEIAEKAGYYIRTQKKQLLELNDCFTAATAFSKRAVLATGNGKHCPMEDIRKVIVGE